MKKILIIEDEEDIANLLNHYLTKEGYAVITASDGLSGLERVQTERPDLVLLDWMLPSLDGLEICKRLRADAETSRLPIIMLTAKGEESDKIVGLEIGADDYISKPFSPKELTVRVKALLRRSEQAREQGIQYRYASLEVDVPRHTVEVAGKTVHLTPKEFGLLIHFLKNIGRVMTREVLLDRVWGYDSEVTTRTVDVHIRRLREKIPFLASAIETVLSHGYKLKDEDET